MDVKNVEWRTRSGGEKVPTIVLKPTHEDGVFTVQWGNGVHVGVEMLISGVSAEDAVAIENGNVATLHKYLETDASKQGTTRLVGARALLAQREDRMGAMTSADGSFMEYAPFSS